MSLLVAAHIGLWVAILVMALLVLSLMRQTGVLLERISPAGLSNQDATALKEGDLVEAQTVTTFSGETLSLGGATGRATALLFTSPRCDVCKAVLPRAVALNEALGTKLSLVVSVGDADGQIPDAYLTSFDAPAVPADTLAAQFGAVHVPHLVLLREDGRIAKSLPLQTPGAFDAATKTLWPGANTSSQTTLKPMETLA